MRGVKHYMQRTAVQGAPAPALRRHRPLDRGRRRADDGVHPFRKSLAELEIGDQLVTATRAGHAGGHRALRQFHRRHLLRPHGRGGGQGEPVLRRPRRPRLPDRLLRRRPLRRPGPRPGARQLRRRQPALPDAGLSRRHPRRAADLQGDQPARRRRARRGALGLPGDQPGRRARRPVRRADHGGEDLAACGRRSRAQAVHQPCPRHPDRSSA